MPKLYSKFLSVVILLSLSLVVVAQDKTQPSIVKADSTWSTEIIPFPIDWLPKLTLKGFEELRFSPNWSDTEHDEFWTLAMAWQVETTTEISIQDLEFNLYHYFDALMHPNHWAQEFPAPKLVLKALEMKDSDALIIKGKLTFFDGLHTGKVMTVNILGNQILCEATGRSVILFRISPKGYDEVIWDTLNAITINDDGCVD